MTAKSYTWWIVPCEVLNAGISSTDKLVWLWLYNNVATGEDGREWSLPEIAGAVCKPLPAIAGSLIALQRAGLVGECNPVTSERWSVTLKPPELERQTHPLADRMCEYREALERIQAELAANANGCRNEALRIASEALREKGAGHVQTAS